MVSAEALREAVEYKITPTRECMDNLAYMERSRDTLATAVRELHEALDKTIFSSDNEDLFSEAVDVHARYCAVLAKAKEAENGKQ